MRDLADLPASELRALIKRRECSSEEIVQSRFEKIRKLESTVKAFVEYQEDGALERYQE